MNSFLADSLGLRCDLRKKSSAVFNDYLDLMNGVERHASELSWRLHRLATVEEYQDWETHMEQGFHRCRKYNGKFSGYYAYVLAHRRVDKELDSWWSEAVAREGFSHTWEDYKVSLRNGFVLPYMEDIQQPPKVEHEIAAVGKSVTTQEKLTVVPLPRVNKAAVTISEVSAVDVVQAAVDKDVLEEVVPLSGLNMQLKRVHDDACMTVDRGQRWNLFQAQCMIKGKACKLMIDSGSYCNGISKAVVEALGLSTWRIPEPRHVEWVNSCGMMKITHKVRVPFTVGDYVDEVECDVLPLEM